MASPWNCAPPVVVTVRVCGSTAATSASLTSTFAWLRKSLRSENPTWLGAICDVATWYSSGWNWWELLRSTSVTRTCSWRARRLVTPPPANPPPTTMTCRRSPPASGMGFLWTGGAGAEALEQVVADAQRVGHGGLGRVDGADAREEARVDDVEVVDLVRPAVGVQDRRRAVAAEPARPGLVGAPGERDLVLEVRVARMEVVAAHAEVPEEPLELAQELALRLLVGRRVGDLHAAVAAHGHPVLEPREVLGRQPEVDGVPGDVAQRPLRRELRLQRLLAAVHLGRRLADHLDVPERVVDLVGAEVEVVEAERLLEHRRVGLAREGQDGRAVVEHVVAPDHVRAVRQAVRRPVARRGEQQPRAVRRAAGHDDDVRAVRLGGPGVIDD